MILCSVDVVMGYISPSTQRYVKKKLGDEAISFETRCHLCELAIADHQTEFRLSPDDKFTLVVDRWEGSQPEFIGFKEVVKNRREYLHKKFPEQEFLVLYLCGMDLYEKWFA